VYTPDILQSTAEARIERARELRLISAFADNQNDGVPWHNNAAERALRHFAVQHSYPNKSFHPLSRPPIVIGRRASERCSPQLPVTNEEIEARRLIRCVRWSAAISVKERSMERRVAKSASREVGIGGENSQRSMIRVSSDLFRFSRGTVAAHAPTNGGLVSMARFIGADLASRDIRVNVVAPGATKTPVWKRGPGSLSPQKIPLSWRSSSLLRFRWVVGANSKNWPKPCSSCVGGFLIRQCG
jgi:NAD(P)-dependent dehydrogenase (short-subunit alcohol dehydrogenase family)